MGHFRGTPVGGVANVPDVNYSNVVNVRDINARLSVGETRPGEFLPRLQDLQRSPRQFRFSFGLDSLPEEPGVIVVRGPRQYGKSTWLEQQIDATVRTHGPGTAFYLNGDEVVDRGALADAVREIISLFRRDAPVRRLFIDEITAVPDWQHAVKRLADSGSLRSILVVTTGSKATDLRRGSERLPGRKGRLARTAYLFTPIAYAEFQRVCGAALGPHTVTAYLLTGGSPIACGHIAEGRLPEYVIEIVKD